LLIIYSFGHVQNFYTKSFSQKSTEFYQQSGPMQIKTHNFSKNPNLSPNCTYFYKYPDGMCRQNYPLT